MLTAALCALALGRAAAQADLSISLFDKRVYVPGSEVLVKVTLRNETATTWRFKLADDKRMSIAFDVRSVSNRPLEPSDSYKRKMASSAPAYYRELSIEPGEEYSFVESLGDYVSLAEPGVFVVRCSMHPELVRLAGKALTGATPATAATAATTTPPALQSNALSLSIRPGAPAPTVAEAFKADTAEILKAERVGPDEVVARTIRARQRSRWNEFFLYLDLERLLRANPDKRRAYDRESDDGRRRMIAVYRNDMMASVVDADISVVPSGFEIVESRYGPSSGTVTVIERFAQDGFSLVKEYTYEVEKRDDVWYIVAYTVLNKGTE